MIHRCCLVAAIVLGAYSCGGCSERPFADYGIASPWARKAWAEDEQYGPTYYTRRNELREQRDQAADLSPTAAERLAVELSQRLTTEPHPVLRAEIVRTLAEIPSPMAEEALRVALQDAETKVRVVACEAWARRGGIEGRLALAQTLGSDTDLDVRMAAARELGKFQGDPEAMKALRLALDENNPAMQHCAVASLRNMSGRDYGADLVAWREFIDGGNPPEPPPPSIAERVKSWY